MKIAVSGCLLGQKVRFDSGHKRDEFIMEDLSKYAEYISFCPENMVFLNPRLSIRLVRNSTDELKVISNKSFDDLTNTLFDATKKDLDAKEKKMLQVQIDELAY